MKRPPRGCSFDKQKMMTTVEERQELLHEALLWRMKKKDRFYRRAMKPEADHLFQRLNVTSLSYYNIRLDRYHIARIIANLHGPKAKKRAEKMIGGYLWLMTVLTHADSLKATNTMSAKAAAVMDPLYEYLKETMHIVTKRVEEKNISNLILVINGLIERYGEWKDRRDKKKTETTAKTANTNKNKLI